jgi:signal transduction histidine kinase
MVGAESITAASAARVRQFFLRWWGGIGCRVSFFMMAALVLVAALVGAFFFWEGEKNLDAEIRGRTFTAARQLSALIAEDIITGNRHDLYKKLTLPFAANEDAQSGSALLYQMVYDNNCDLLIGSTPTDVFFNSDSYFYTLPGEKKKERENVALKCDLSQTHSPVLVTSKNGVYDLTLPVMVGKERVGFVQVGVSGEPSQKKFFGIVNKSAVALLGILLVGLAFSRIIAVDITRPIQQLSEAAEKLGRQNWDSPLPVRGTDEISKLSMAFNQMALTLKQREASLSRGNRDLFLLHTAGLDLMESLDRNSLLAKVAARAEDLVRAETTAVSVVDSATRSLKYVGVYGAKAEKIRERELPLEAGGIYNWLASYGTPLLIADAQADFRLDGASMRSLGIKSLLTVPLWSANTMVGLLTTINKKGGAGFNKHDLRLFTVFGNMASVALQNSSLYGDLTQKMYELKTAQEQLVHSTKMAAIGELSANVAHEINNPLTSVLGYTTHLLKTLDIPEAPRKVLGIMEQETLRARKIIRNLLDFARQRPAWLQPEDIMLPMRETVSLIQGLADASSVRIHEEYPSEPFLVNIDHNEIKQVFINVVNNALQAMPQGGELRIRLEQAGENDIVAAVADTGVGIAPEHLSRIFEPFFSTKDNGGGTGLGLSISYRIIQNHGGRVETESAVGKGTIFRIYLPRYRPARLAQNAWP